MKPYLPVEVYFNLHKKLFSVRQGGLVVAHERCITLKDAVFRVSQAGRNRVLREKRKNVHAIVKGMASQEIINADGLAYYNPYKTETFLDADGEPLLGAKLVCLWLEPETGKPKISYEKH